MKISKPIMIGAAATAAAVILSLFLFFRPLEVPSVAVVRGTISSGVEEDGYVQAIDDRNLYATQNARILEVPVEAGDAVARGKILVRMSNPDLDAALAEVRAYSNQADKSVAGYAATAESMRLLLANERRTLERSIELFKAGAISRSELEQASLRVDRVEKDLAEAESVLASAGELRKGLRDQLGELEKKSTELTVTSPIDGYVLNLPVKKDQVTAPGDFLVGLAVRGEMEIRSDVLSDTLGSVETGQNVRITAPVLGGVSLEGRVKKIYPMAEEKISPLGVEQRRVPVIITLPVTGVLKPGYEVRVFIVTARRHDALILPVESVRTEDGTKKAFKVTGGKIRIIAVKTGITDRRMVEVTDGLEEGDVIVRDASLDLREGQRVRGSGAR